MPDAVSDIVSTFKQYGLGNLANVVVQAYKQGYQGGALMDKVRASHEYQQRFAGNAQRLKAGLTPLTEAEYLKTESAIRSTLQNMGMPAGFYDKPADLQKFIARDISPAEVAQRAQQAYSWVNSKDQATLDALQQYYGIDRNHIAAYALDPTRSILDIKKMADVAALGAEQIRSGLTGLQGDYTAALADKGITADQARQAFGQVKSEQSAWATEAQAEGVSLKQTELADSALGLGGEGDAKKRQFAKQQAARFAGAGAGTASLLDSGASGSY